jgi:tRNA wybutosine-synthesizing protein 1
MKKAKLAAREADDPELIIKGIVKQRRMLISGIGGAADVDRSRFLTTLNEFPSHWAISLSGEPTIYPKLAELIRSLKAHKEVRSIFLVTNGQEQSAISKLVAQCALPTQLYVSISAPDEKAYRQLNKPIYRDGWKRLMKTLCMLKQISRKGCRTVIRLTLMRGINDSSCAAASFAKIFEKAQPDFIEVKSYMFLGLSRKRLKKENMPLHADVKAFCKLLAKNLPSYKWEDEDKRSRVVLFKRKDSRFGKKIKWC